MIYRVNEWLVYALDRRQFAVGQVRKTSRDVHRHVNIIGVGKVAKSLVVGRFLTKEDAKEFAWWYEGEVRADAS